MKGNKRTRALLCGLLGCLPAAGQRLSLRIYQWDDERKHGALVRNDDGVGMEGSAMRTSKSEQLSIRKEEQP